MKQDNTSRTLWGSNIPVWRTTPPAPGQSPSPWPHAHHRTRSPGRSSLMPRLFLQAQWAPQASHAGLQRQRVTGQQHLQKHVPGPHRRNGNAPESCSGRRDQSWKQPKLTHPPSWGAVISRPQLSPPTVLGTGRPQVPALGLLGITTSSVACFSSWDAVSVRAEVLLSSMAVALTHTLRPDSGSVCVRACTYVCAVTSSTCASVCVCTRAYAHVEKCALPSRTAAA